jgi:hypothetical protein
MSSSAVPAGTPARVSRSRNSWSSHRDEHRADPVKCLGKVAWVVEACGTDAKAVGFAEGMAGFVGVADERGDRIAARE